MSFVEPGKARSLVKVRPGAIDPLRLFSHLSSSGNRPHSFLLESAEVHQGNAERSIACAAPCLKISGRGLQWEMEAFHRTGGKILKALPSRLGFSETLELEDGENGPLRLSGRLPRPRAGLEERDRLREPGPMDLLRSVHGLLEADSPTGFPSGGLFGAFSYDFVSTFEELPDEQDDPHPVDDYTFYFSNHLFLIDHLRDRSIFVATALGLEDPEEEYAVAQEHLRHYEQAAEEAGDLPALEEALELLPEEVQTDLDDEAFAGEVSRLKEHILAGDVFQIVPSRSFEAPLREAPLQVYRRLRELNPSPYMFYFRFEESSLIGASPETALQVDRERRVWIRPIAGTRPRGLLEGRLDRGLDARYEAELKLDGKELAEHVMLVDLARNDIARVSQSGSRAVERLFSVEKYSHVQHLVSEVSGELREGLDPLHAYLATMNMGTLTGAPKVEAMRLLRQCEKTRRGFYGGAVGYWLLDGEFDTAIVIRSLLLFGDRALTRAGAGVVFDSIPEREAEETTAKARAPLAALGLGRGK